MLSQRLGWIGIFIKADISIKWPGLQDSKGTARNKEKPPDTTSMLKQIKQEVLICEPTSTLIQSMEKTNQMLVNAV